MARSYLFVPANSEKMMSKAFAGEADAIILDLEDSIIPEKKADARAFLKATLPTLPRGRKEVWVRVNPVETDDFVKDLAVVVELSPTGLMLPKARSLDCIAKASAQLDDLESAHNIAKGSIGLFPLITETAVSMLHLGSYEGGHPRLRAVSWGPEDLAADIGAAENRTVDGELRPLYQMARSGCLIAAAAAGVPAIETIDPDFKDTGRAERTAREALRDGFSGRMAIHPAQVGPINAAFTPTSADIDQARNIISAFKNSGGAGAIQMDGRMFDIPHLKAAHRTLARAEAAGITTT